MSNNTNQVAVPETEAPVEEQPKVKKPKNVASRIFAFLFAAIAVAALFLPYSIVIKANGVNNEPVRTSLFNAILGLFNNEATGKLFGFLPVYPYLLLDQGANSPMNISGVVTAFIFYLFIITY